MSTAIRDRGTARGDRRLEPEPAPRARRLERPGWRDLRLVVGAALVLVSVAGGVRLVTALDDTTPVYAASRDLLPGQPVTPDDLVVVPARLEDGLDRYVDAGAPLAPGTHLLRAVSAGELVPATALGTASQGRDKTVSVPVDSVAAQSLTTGAVVDVWVSRRDGKAVGEKYRDPELLLERAVVDHVPAASSGLGAGLGTTSVHVVVPADRVGDVIGAVDQGGRVTLVPAPRAVPAAGSQG